MCAAVDIYTGQGMILAYGLDVDRLVVEWGVSGLVLASSKGVQELLSIRSEERD